LFRGFTLDDPGTLAEIRHLWTTAGYLADPHTAVGTAAARTHMPEDPSIPVVIAATAHPAKFPDAVERATGLRPPLPARMADLYEREERFSILPPDLAGVEAFVRSHVRRNIA
ncbi:MAG TPA: threonine synthase, partial [Armatimonadota bacterium]|nr:threonine synthase [Armatimonadota bacterium]